MKKIPDDVKVVEIKHEDEKTPLVSKKLEALYDWLISIDILRPSTLRTFPDVLDYLVRYSAEYPLDQEILTIYLKPHTEWTFLFEEFNWDPEYAANLCQVLRSIKDFSKSQFLECCSLPKEYKKEGINLLGAFLDCGGCLLLRNDNKKVHWKLMMENIPYAGYLKKVVYASKHVMTLEFFNFVMDIRIFTSPTVFLEPILSALLDDINKPPEDLTIHSPIQKHAAQVYHYLKFKTTKKKYESESDDDSDDEATSESKIKANEDSEMMKSHHDITHLASAAFLVPVLVNFYARHGDERAKELKAEDIKLFQIAALFHDLARQGEGTDWWDHDSGLALYYYLHLVLKVSHQKAKELAEMVANKDAESLGFYRRLEDENGSLRWQKTTFVPILTIGREILHAVDCLEVQRVRGHFHASHLHIVKSILGREEPLNELAQLITEVKGSIAVRGDSYNNRNFTLKKEFHHAGVYKAIHDSYFQPEDLNYPNPYRIIPKLYNPNGFHESMSIEKLPHEQLLPVKDEYQRKMYQGNLYARAIICPTQFIKSKISKRTQIPKPPETRFDFERRKISRIPEEPTRSGATGKNGFDFRSGSMIGYQAQLFGAVGLIYEMDLKDLVEISTDNIKSGFGKKEKYRKKLEEHKPDRSKLVEKHKTLIDYLKMGFNPEQKKVKSTHNEIILTAKLANVRAIYFTRAPIKNEPAIHAYARILLAIHMQKLFEKHGKTYPIVEYSNAPSMLREMSFSDNQILRMWKELCLTYFEGTKNSKAKEVVSTLTIDELETRCLYGNDEKGNFSNPDEFYSKELRQEVRKILRDLKTKFLSSNEKETHQQGLLGIFAENTKDSTRTQAAQNSNPKTAAL
jgi:hypothetical protein